MSHRATERVVDGCLRRAAARVLQGEDLVSAISESASAEDEYRLALLRLVLRVGQGGPGADRRCRAREWAGGRDPREVADALLACAGAPA